METPKGKVPEGTFSGAETFPSRYAVGECSTESVVSKGGTQQESTEPGRGVECQEGHFNHSGGGQCPIRVKKSVQWTCSLKPSISKRISTKNKVT